MHILEHLDPKALAAGPKIVMGYSDITALLIALYQRHSWVTFHGPMVAKDFAAGQSHYDRETFINVLLRPWASIAHSPLPFNCTLCGLPGALSAIFRFPIRGPLAVGLNDI